MKIAVTGCNGSVGTRVVLSALARGHTVIGIDAAPLSETHALAYIDTNRGKEGKGTFAFRQADLREYEVGLIVHLAAMRDPGDYVIAAHNT